MTDKPEKGYCWTFTIFQFKQPDTIVKVQVLVYGIEWLLDVL